MLFGTTWLWAATPTFSATITFTVTATFTAAATNSATATSTGTPTATATYTASLIPSFTSTCTPTLTISPTVTETPTVTLSATPGQTASVTATPVMAAATFSPTVTLTMQTATPANYPHQPSPASPVVIRQNIVRPSQNQSLSVGVWLDTPQRVVVRIYTQNGHLVKVLEDRLVGAGKFETAWAGVNQNGSVVGSGVYFVEIQTEHFNEKRKLVVLR
jgi:hypothetical protein